MSGSGHDVEAADEFLAPGEVARRLHVSPKTINRWANDGRIPCIVTLGGHRRFRHVDIDAAVEKMTAAGAALSS